MDAPGWWIFIAAGGAFIGSFLNVCIHRLPLGRSIVQPRSACPSCERMIPWYHNIPILSYIVLRGRCASCGAPFSIRYLLVEAVTAVLFALLFLSRGFSFAFVLHTGLAAALVVLIVIDARHQILPDAITLPGIAVGIMTSPLRAQSAELFSRGSLQALGEATFGAALGFAILWAINASYRGWQAVRGVPPAERIDGIGRGDFKLLAMIGAFLGSQQLLFSLFVGAFSGATFGLYMMWSRGYGWKSKLPYGVFLGGAAILALFVGDPAVGWYLRSIGLDH